MPQPEAFLPTTINWPFHQDVSSGAWYPQFAPHPFTPVGNHQSVLLTTNVLTLSPPDNATEVLIQVLEINCRFTLDGTTPTTSSGFQLLAGDSVIMSISKTTTIKIIGEETGAGVEYQFGR
jgi:hypothetical protein